MRNITRTAICSVIASALAFSLLPASALAESAVSEEQPVSELAIDGLVTSWNKKPESVIADKVSVTPAGTYELALERYSTATKSWELKAEFATDENGAGKLVYPNEWAEANSSTWRVRAIEIGDSSEAATVTSPHVKIVTRNRSTVSLCCKSAVVMSAASGNIYYGKYANTRRAMASTTKIMTALLAIENCKLSEKVKITKTAANTPYTGITKSTVGSYMYLKDLLYMALLPSDNGAANALAIHVAGSRAKFAKMMNAKAKKLGLTNTHFVNAHGLDATGHYSTAADLAKLAAYAYSNATFAKICGTTYHYFKTTNKKYSYVARSTNQLLRAGYAGVVGMKTGTTGDAGCCLVCAYKYNGHVYITVALGATYDAGRYTATKALLKYIRTYKPAV